MRGLNEDEKMVNNPKSYHSRIFPSEQLTMVWRRFFMGMAYVYIWIDATFPQINTLLSHIHQMNKKLIFTISCEFQTPAIIKIPA